MEVKLLKFPHKEIRAQCIKEYMQKAGYSKAVCFSCGNAATALLKQGIETLHIGTKGELCPLKWWTQAEIEKWFSNCFDATSGHLPISLYRIIGEKYKEYLGELPDVNFIPTGSGETLVCLKLAYPEKSFIAVYNIDTATQYDKEAPLNKIVELLADKIIFANKSIND